jgi:hypothetical protein
MWGQPLEFEGLDLPEGCELTADKRRFPDATAVVFHVPSALNIDHIPKRPGQVWVAWSMECEVNYPNLLDPDFMRRFEMTMTYRRDSDVPVPYYGSDLIPHLRTPPIPKTEDKLVALFVSSLFDRSGRMSYIRELMAHVDVHSYGRVLRNMNLKEDAGWGTKLRTIADYKFTIAFENAIGRDYVTEKFFDPLLAGSVPVYLGAPNINEFAPAHNCFINVANFSTPKDLAEYLLTLNNEEAAYQKHLAWKKEPIRPGFMAMVDEVREHPFVRLCRKVREMCEQLQFQGSVGAVDA